MINPSVFRVAKRYLYVPTYLYTSSLYPINSINLLRLVSVVKAEYANGL